MWRLPSFLLFVLLAVTSCLQADAAKKYSDRLPKQSERTARVDIDSLQSVVREISLHHIEGLWRLTTDGSTVAIIRDDSGTGYRMILIESPNRALRPGTCVGLLSPSAVKSTYEARIYTRTIGSRLYSPARFNLKLSDDDTRLVFERVKGKYSFNPLRLIPYSWRLGVQKRTEPDAIQGAVRVYPAPERPAEPLYL